MEEGGRGDTRIFPFYLCFSWRLIERCRGRGMLLGAMRFVAFRSDSGSGVINDIVELIAFRREGTEPQCYRPLVPFFSSKFPLLPSSPNRWKMFQFRPVESPLSFSDWVKKKDSSRTNRITRWLNIRFALFRSEKILIPIHMKWEWREIGIKVSRSVEIDGLLHIYNAGNLFRGYSGNLRHFPGKYSVLFFA